MTKCGVHGCGYIGACPECHRIASSMVESLRARVAALEGAVLEADLALAYRPDGSQQKNAARKAHNILAPVACTIHAGTPTPDPRDARIAELEGIAQRYYERDNRDFKTHRKVWCGCMACQAYERFKADALPITSRPAQAPEAKPSSPCDGCYLSYGSKSCDLCEMRPKPSGGPK